MPAAGRACYLGESLLMVLLWAAPAALAQSPSEQSPPATAMRTRSFELYYRLAGDSRSLLRVELWFSRDAGQSWQRYGADQDCQPPIRFQAPHEGLYGFYVIAVNAAGPSSPPPGPDTMPQLWCLVDWTPPAVQLHVVRKAANFSTTRLVQIHWSAYDAHLLPHPVRLYYRRPGQRLWQAIQRELPNIGRYDWSVPPVLTGPIQIKLVVCDRAGNRAEHISPQLFIDPPSPQPTRRSAARASADAPGPPDAELATTTAPSPSAAQRARRLYELGSWHLLRNELPVAAERFREALQLDPALLEARNDLAGILHEQGRYAAALQEYRRVLALMPSHPNALMGLALTHMRRREYPQAYAALQRLLLTRPDDPQVWLDLGDAALMMGRRAAARSYWTKAVQVDHEAGGVMARAQKRLAAYPAKP
ncbi:MAG: tetratricopeptide repeat protein [Phycisphaerae bacterium]